MRLPGSLLALTVLAALASTLDAQRRPPGPRVGDPVPGLQLEAVLQAPDGAAATREALAGRPAVLEFWATWCGPCVANIPHFNELVDEYGDRIRFLSITDEGRQTVERFLEDRQLSGWIGLDDEHRTFTAFGVSAIPRTFLIDAGGIVRAITHPSNVDGETLARLLNGDDLGLEDLSQSSMSLLRDAEITLDGPAPLMQAIVRPTQVTFRGRSQNRNRGTKKIFGASPAALLEEMFGLTPPRMDVQAELPDQLYEADVKALGRPELRDEIGRLAVLAAFGLEMATEEREVEVLVLEELLDRDRKMPVAGPGSGTFFHGDDSDAGTSSIGGLAGHRQLVHALEILSGRPVVNEVLTGRYRVPSTEWRLGDLDSMRAALRGTLGIELRPERRRLEIAVFRPAN